MTIYSLQEKLTIADEYRKSGLTQEQYAAQKGVSVSSINRWIKLPQQLDTSFAMIPVKSEKTEARVVQIGMRPHDTEVVVKNPCGTEITINMLPDPKWMADFVRKLV